MSPVCPSMLPNMQPWSLIPSSPADATRAQRTNRQKLCLKTDKPVSLLTDRTSTPPLTLMKLQRTKRREAHALVSRFLFFPPPLPSQAFFHSLALSLSLSPRGWKQHRVAVSGVKSPLYHLPCRPDIGLPLPVWSHRWRWRWWSWKLAASSHGQRQVAVGRINMWQKVSVSTSLTRYDQWLTH